MTTAEARITPTCELCEKAINPGTGGLDINPLPALDAANTMYAWDREHGDQVVVMSDVPDVPRRVHWRWAHWSCTCEGANYYFIDLERIDTARKAMRWTDHLSGKRWFGYTDWFDVMDKVSWVP